MRMYRAARTVEAQLLDAIFMIMRALNGNSTQITKSARRNTELLLRLLYSTKHSEVTAPAKTTAKATWRRRLRIEIFS